MSQRRRAVIIAALVFAFAVPQAHADVIRIDDPERERVKSLLARPEVSAEMERMGIPADEARARVEAMTPAEVSQLAGRLDALPAGGAASQRDLLLVIILLLLLIIIL